MKTAVERKPVGGIEPLLSMDEIASLLGVTRRAVERLRSTGALPRPDVKVGRCLRWKSATVREWIDSGLPGV
jgi:excisionase family DNA binding protein